MSIPLDAREILIHLNNLGYRNITAEHLKEFMRDLKKLIKYESRYSNADDNIDKRQLDEQQKEQSKHLKEISNYFERLHITSTAASRAKLHSPVLRNQNRPTSTISSRPIPATTTSTPVHKVNPAKHQIGKENQVVSVTDRIVPLISLAKTDNTNIEKIPKVHKVNEIVSDRPISTKDLFPKTVYFVRNTPTDLYQQYQKDWLKFKRFVPGENSRSDVRLKIRERMQKIQTPKPKPKVYVAVNSDQDKVIKRYL